MVENPPPQVTDNALMGKIARGAAWVMGAGFFARMIGALNTIVVARLLAPDDIGIVAVATVTMQMLQGFSDIGVSQAVVKFRDATRDDFDTLFTFAAIRGVVVAALLAAAAPLAAGFYDDPRMFWVFMGVALFPLVTGFLNPRFYEFERDLSFSREFIVVAVNKSIGVIVSIAIAVIYRNYWAIIGGLVAGGVVQLFLSYVMRPYLPRISFRSFRKVFGFSSWLAGVAFMAALNNKLDVPVLARFAGSSGAGAFFMGKQLSGMITEQIAAPLSRAIYPGLSSLQENVDRMRRAFLQGFEALALIATPTAVGFAFVAEDLVRVLLGDKWGEAAPVIQILSPVIGIQCLFYATQYYAVAQGKTKLVFFRELIFFLVRFPLIVWGALAGGLLGMTLAVGATGLFQVALNLALYAQVSGRPFWEPLAQARRSFAAVVIMGGVLLIMRAAIPDFDAYPVALRLVIEIIVGAAAFVGGLLLAWRASGATDGVEAMALAAVKARLGRV